MHGQHMNEFDYYINPLYSDPNIAFDSNETQQFDHNTFTQTQPILP